MSFPLGPLGASNALAGAAGKAAAGKTRTVEETYQKLTQLEHILKRPDTYIGSVEAVTQPGWVYDRAAKRMTPRTLTYVPGLYKIFDEIVVNAADNKQRDASMDTVRVDIDRVKGSISVYNNGQGIPVEMHKEHGCYVPELVFGHLLTSSNYDDEQQKVTGGRNGYGAKLANIFSTEFMVETSDCRTGLQYKQTFSNNMRARGKPTIKATTKPDWTRITFTPDLAKFGMDALDDDICALMARRVVDLAGCTDRSVKLYLDGERVPVADFKSYVDLYIGVKGAEGAKVRVYERVSDRWEVCVAPSDEGFAQVSFVNSIATTKGGKHVDHVVDQLVAKLADVLKKKDKSAAALKPHAIKGHVAVFINCLIVNPAFDSQTKEHMTLVPSKFGSKCELDDKFLKQVAGCGIVDSILEFLTHKNQKDLAKSNKGKRERLTGISKLDDANEAGGRRSRECTLILTEGDSAKALAVSGLSVIGRDFYGVFPLRGKLLNVRDAPPKMVNDNAELTHLKQIMGLQHGKKYTDDAALNTLRYGHLMIMTDQDHDGSHIKGLVINYLHVYWPELLQHAGFLQEFVTPIVKASKGSLQRPFFTLPEYDAWREAQPTLRGWTIKYYKGLGTSTSAEAKEYFSDLPKHELRFAWGGSNDGALIDLAFSKKKADERKVWLQGYVPGTHVDHSQAELPYDDFINKELILFSRADNVRSIPSLVDGFKPGQRKILFGCFKRKLRGEVKVAQLSGYIGEHSAYHHGEASLQGTIVNMAQDYVGANNINLLHPAGQFGTRLQGGKDHASARYIFTRLSPITRFLFPEADDAVLTYLEDDGQPIEPAFYVPVLPLVLVNGAEGIGTGWATSVPNYNPLDIVANLRRLMAGEEPLPMTPWYRGFGGSIVPSKANSYAVCGRAEQLDERTVLISELPLRKWTQDYKEALEAMMVPGKDGEGGAVTDFKEHHTDTTVSFTVTLSEAGMAAALSEGLLKKFKLTSTLAESNLVLWDEHGRIRKYEGTTEILAEFFDVRKRTYAKRKAWQADRLSAEWEKLKNKARFIQAVIDGQLVVAKKAKAALVELLRAEDYLPILPDKPKRAPVVGVDAGEAEAEGAGAEEGGGDGSAERGHGGYDYLLSMPLWSLTAERVASLRAECAAKEAELSELLGKSPLDLWNADLDAFELAYAAFLEDKDKAEANAKRLVASSKGGKAGAGKGAGARPKLAAKPKAAAPPAPAAALKAAGGGAGASARPKAAKRAASSSEDESDASDSEFDSDSDSDFCERGKGKASAGAKRAALPQPPAAAPIFAKAAAAAGPSQQSKPKAAAPKASKPPPKPAAVVNLADSDSEEDAPLGVSLAARLEARAAQPAAKGPALKAARPAAPRAPAAAAPIDLDGPSHAAAGGGMGAFGAEGDDPMGAVLAAAARDPFAFAAAPPAGAKKAAPKPRAPAASRPPPKRKHAGSESEEPSEPSASESDSGSEYGGAARKRPLAKKPAAAKPKAPAAVKPKPPVAAKPKPAAKPAAKRAARVVSSDDDENDENEPIARAAAAPPAAGSRRPARQAAVSSRGKWVEKEGSGSGSEDESEGGHSADDSGGSDYAG